jgi:hypothetical protein
MVATGLTGSSRNLTSRVPWQSIGHVLEISKQAAWERFGRDDPTQVAARRPAIRRGRARVEQHGLGLTPSDAEDGAAVFPVMDEEVK